MKKKNLQASSKTFVLYAQALQSYQQKNLPAALVTLEQAINIDPNFHLAFALGGKIFLETGQTQQAVDCYSCAVRAAPEQKEYKAELAMLLGFFRFQVFSADMQQVLLNCLRTPGIDHQSMSMAWSSLLILDPDFAPLYKTAGAKDYAGFKKDFLAVKNHKAATSDYFLEGLQRILVFDLEFERFLTYLRRFLLEEFEGKGPAIFGDNFLSLVAGIALYCDHNEFVFSITDEEKKVLDQIGKRLESEADTVAFSVYGCYRSLAGLKKARDFYKNFIKFPALKTLVQVQIGDVLEMQEMRTAIPAITEIDDSISSLVRDQYEQFPYPRWHEIFQQIRSESAEGYLRGKKAEILVAGCGTGIEAMELAAVFPEAKVLAIDLSLSSLSYAVKKNREYGFKNIEFCHGDILRLGALNKKFDYIASSGVLHHMEDPFKGWSVLTGLLKPKGLMRIALYSRFAHRNIMKAQKVIQEKGYSSDADDIRIFRQHADEILPSPVLKSLANMRDYYCTSECRDMLFHVQEQRFDIPRIAEYLERLDLEFIEFDLEQKQFAEYDRQCRGAARDKLENWHDFEQKNPDTFLSMYRFWCRLKS